MESTCNQDLGAYNMIIGRDIIQDLEFEISYKKDKTITWDDHSVPLRSRDTTAEEAYYIRKPKAVEESTNGIKEDSCHRISCSGS